MFIGPSTDLILLTSKGATVWYSVSVVLSLEDGKDEGIRGNVLLQLFSSFTPLYLKTRTSCPFYRSENDF